MAYQLIPRDKQLNILGFLVRPVVRFCIRNSHSIQDLINVTKFTFVEAAREELEKSGEKANVSRIAVMTGLYRDEVTRISKETNIAFDERVDVLGRVLEHWLQNDLFSTKSGTPRVLTFGFNESEFAELCSCVTKNVHHGTILFELERLGLVQKTKRGVKRVQRIQTFAHDPFEGYRSLGKEIDAYISTVHKNLEFGPETADLHFFTDYDNIYEDKLPQIRQWLWQQGKTFNRRVRNYLAKFDKDISPRKDDKPAGRKVQLGLFGRGF